MTSDEPADSSQGGVDMRMVWQLLTDEEQREFWKFAGKHARDLNHGTATFRRLCAALRDAEAGKTGGRSTNGLPGSVRPLSSDELQRSIGKVKSRLLEQPNAEPFLIGAFCVWIQDSCLAVLNAVLDTVKCPRDERGTLRGSIPDFSPDDAARDICALAATHGAHALALVCGGLMLNRSLWTGLGAAFEALNRMALGSSTVNSAQPQPTREPQVEAVAGSIGPKAESIDVDSLQAIREGLELLRQHLADATADISAAKVPDLEVAIECWRQVRRQHVDAEGALGVSSPCIADLEAALARRSEVALALSDLAHCRSIVHVIDPNFSGCAIIHAKCDELEKGLGIQVLDPISLRAVTALLSLVEDGDRLDDEDAAQLQVEVDALFGKSVAAAALRGKLSFAVAFPRTSTEGSGASEPAQNLPVDNPALQPVAAPIDPPSAPIAQAEPKPKALPEAAKVEAQQSNASEGDEADELAASGSAPNASAPGVPGSVQPTHSGDETHAPIEVEQGANEAATTAPSGASALTARRRPTPDPEFESFESFCRSHWVDATGSVVPAPWRIESFAAELTQRALEAWELGEAAIAHIFSRAVCADAAPDPLGTDDLASADRLLSDPAMHSAGMDAGRAERLRMRLEEPAAIGQRSIGLALMLEALRPTHPCSFTPPEIEGLLERASYNDPALSDLVRFLLLGWSAQLNPLSSLRARLLDAPEEPVEVVEAALRSAQAALRTEVATLWSAAGGKIQRTHCRSAWAKFVQEEVVPLRDELAPSDVKASTRVKWTPVRIRERVIAFGRSFQRIMDSAQVRHQDRSVAEGAAQQIVEAVGQVGDALQRLDSQRQRSHASYDGIPHEAGLRLLSGSSSSTTNRLCASLFAAGLHGKPQSNVLRLKVGYLITHVDVIRYLSSNALSRPGIARDGVCALDFEDPAPVSALLLGWRAQEPCAVHDDSELWVALRNAAADRERRDILAALSSTDVLQAHERTLLHRYALELGDGAFETTRELERLWAQATN